MAVSLFSFKGAISPQIPREKINLKEDKDSSKENESNELLLEKYFQGLERLRLACFSTKIPGIPRKTIGTSKLKRGDKALWNRVKRIETVALELTFPIQSGLNFVPGKFLVVCGSQSSAKHLHVFYVFWLQISLASDSVVRRRPFTMAARLW